MHLIITDAVSSKVPSCTGSIASVSRHFAPPCFVAPTGFGTCAGASLPAADLLRMAQDLDKPPDEAHAQNGKGSAGGVAGDGGVSSSDSQSGEDRPRGKGHEPSGKRAAGGGETSSSKLSQEPSASFARPTPPKRPKISLDLDDLDSDSDEEDDEDSD